MLHRHTPGYGQPTVCKTEDELPETKLLSTQLQNLALDTNQAKYLQQNLNKTVSNKYTIPQEGLSEALSYSLIHNELTLDGNPHLNLASFVNTCTTDIAKKLISENINKNLADNDEYPQLIELTQRCISILAEIWKCGENDKPIGCSTTGSSEAIMLGGLAMKKQWEKKMITAGKDHSKPNIIMSSACQVALEKFARYFDVECRLVPVSSESNFGLDPNLLEDYVDENTIGCFVIMGTTYTGHLEPIEVVVNKLTEIEAKHPDWVNTEIPIHIDGASGGFIIPFSFNQAQLRHAGIEKWCFNQSRVVSINTSGHKFGLTTPGLGWVLWKQEDYLVPELRFRLKYLGGIEETFGLNFSRPGFQVVHQYFNFISKGFEGYRNDFKKALFVARTFSYGLLHAPNLKDHIEIVSSIHQRIDDNSIPENVNDYLNQYDEFKPGIPLVAFKLSDKFKKKYPEIPQVILSTMLRKRGWIVPNYPLPKSTDGSDKWEVLRVVFRSEMRLDLAQMLLRDITLAITTLLRSYDKINGQMAVTDEQARRTLIYEVLLNLASPEEEEKEEENPTVAKIKHRNLEKGHFSRNYRGTC